MKFIENFDANTVKVIGIIQSTVNAIEGRVIDFWTTVNEEMNEMEVQHTELVDDNNLSVPYGTILGTPIRVVGAKLSVVE